jgi:hypothetical protein
MRVAQAATPVTRVVRVAQAATPVTRVVRVAQAATRVTRRQAWIIARTGTVQWMVPQATRKPV